MINWRKQTHYRLIAFDIDDTLIRLRGVQERLLAAAVTRQAPLPVASADFYEVFLDCSGKRWQALDAELISVSEFRVARYQDTFDHFDLRLDVSKIIEFYDSGLSHELEFLPGAGSLLENLHGNYDLLAITNGVLESQTKRLQNAGWEKYFIDVIAPENAGQAKPHVKIFDTLLQRNPQYKRNEILIVGDNPKTDIKGAHQAGIDSCWLNENNRSEVGTQATHEVTNLTELKNLLVGYH